MKQREENERRRTCWMFKKGEEEQWDGRKMEQEKIKKEGGERNKEGKKKESRAGTRVLVLETQVPCARVPRAG